jgi:hypothetical protein
MNKLVEPLGIFAARGGGLEESKAPAFTDHEKERGFEPPVFVSIDEALKLLHESRAATQEGRDYIVPRDIAILNEAKKYL